MVAGHAVARASDDVLIAAGSPMTEFAERIRRARTLLFVPGRAARPARPCAGIVRRLVVVDLEASVRPVEKSAARATMVDWLPRCRALRACARAPQSLREPVVCRRRCGDSSRSVVRGSILADGERADDVAKSIAAAPARLSAIALIETAAGILEAPGHRAGSRRSPARVRQHGLRNRHAARAGVTARSFLPRNSSRVSRRAACHRRSQA